MNSASSLRSRFLSALAVLALAGQAVSYGQAGSSTPTASDSKSVSQNAAASTAPQEPKPPIAGNKTGNFFKNLVSDQKAFLKSPLAINGSNAKWLIPLAGATAALIATDRRTSSEINSWSDPLGRSNSISRLGAGYVTFGAAGSMFALGALTHREHLRDTGTLVLEALIDSSVVAGALKAASRRQRPSQGGGAGHFWQDGSSFPSGHTITTFALATVVAERYRDKPLVQIGAFAFAGLVGVSRVTSHSHFPSDALVGGSLGYLIGRYVVRAHGKDDHRNAPTISPYFSRETRTYGIGMSMQF